MEGSTRPVKSNTTIRRDNYSELHKLDNSAVNSRIHNVDMTIRLHLSELLSAFREYDTLINRNSSNPDTLLRIDSLKGGMLLRIESIQSLAKEMFLLTNENIQRNSPMNDEIINNEQRIYLESAYLQRTRTENRLMMVNNIFQILQNPDLGRPMPPKKLEDFLYYMDHSIVHHMYKKQTERQIENGNYPELNEPFPNIRYCLRPTYRSIEDELDQDIAERIFYSPELPINARKILNSPSRAIRTFSLRFKDKICGATYIGKHTKLGQGMQKAKEITLKKIKQLRELVNSIFPHHDPDDGFDQ